jgi:hypothetical protein
MAANSINQRRREPDRRLVRPGVQWLDYHGAHDALRFDSNRTALGELHQRLRLRANDLASQLEEISAFLTRTPGRRAVWDGKTSLTAQELDEESRQLAVAGMWLDQGCGVW